MIPPMVAAVRQMVKVQSNGRIEILAPEFRAGTVMEVIVLLPGEAATSNAADRLAAMRRLRESIGLSAQSAEKWMDDVRNERDTWNPPAAS
jgi:ABC-type cobalamin transport system ATPase subunit